MARVDEIRDLVARCRVRLSPERAYALITACEDLLDSHYPNRPYQEANRGLARPSGDKSPALQGQMRLFR